MLMLNRLACLCPKDILNSRPATAKGESVEVGSNESPQHCAVTPHSPDDVLIFATLTPNQI
jgi:hypothetical protein